MMPFRLFAAAATLALVAAPTLAAPAPDAKLDASAHRVRGHLEFLSSDLLEGRDTGSRGHEIAATYVASQFDALGLKPAGENGSWYQWVPFRESKLVAGSSSARFTGKDGKAVDLGTDQIVMRPSMTAKDASVDAGLVFAGYGLDDPKLGFNDYAGLDARGKIVVVIRGAPGGLNSDIASHLGDIKGETAARHGAVGLIEIGPRAPKVSTVPLPPFLLTVGSVDWMNADGSAGTVPALARISVSAKTQEMLFASAPTSLQDIRKRLETPGARPKGFPLPGRLALKAKSDWRDFKSPEVIAKLEGADPVLRNEHVAMMGHLDHIGIKANAKPGEDAIYNGTLDNAAGVATLLEAAKSFVDSGQRPKRSVLFVVHTGEEKGLLGASYFAHKPTVPLASIVGGVDLDMPMPLYKFTDVVAFGADHSTIVEAVREAGRSMGVTVSPDPMPQEGIFVRSDHYMFVQRGIPAILLFTGYSGGGKDKFEEFMAKRYHNVGDDMSQPIMFDQLARYAVLNYRIARQLADQADRPRWYKDNYFGDTFAKGQPRATLPSVVGIAAPAR